MTDRLSTWSQVMLARWLANAACPNVKCLEMNAKGRKPLIELNEQGAAYCNACGLSWSPPRPTVTPVN